MDAPVKETSENYTPAARHRQTYDNACNLFTVLNKRGGLNVAGDTCPSLSRAVAGKTNEWNVEGSFSFPCRLSLHCRQFVFYLKKMVDFRKKNVNLNSSCTSSHEPLFGPGGLPCSCDLVVERDVNCETIFKFKIKDVQSPRKFGILIVKKLFSTPSFLVDWYMVFCEGWRCFRALSLCQESKQTADEVYQRPIKRERESVCRGERGTKKVPLVQSEWKDVKLQGASVVCEEGSAEQQMKGPNRVCLKPLSTAVLTAFSSDSQKHRLTCVFDVPFQEKADDVLPCMCDEVLQC
ncbi:hypothetical protein DNTS_017282 [Danionella cerebrum]|uniref:Uncharacterized protein n=1 Tax=Danionella cerebrum TaxID=2873325 RepID=A0A553QHS0_9TELE|nr:hypothetical protein DNTS_017282 [Danionella translucida]